MAYFINTMKINLLNHKYIKETIIDPNPFSVFIFTNEEPNSIQENLTYVIKDKTQINDNEILIKCFHFDNQDEGSIVIWFVYDLKTKINKIVSPYLISSKKEYSKLTESFNISKKINNFN